MQIKASGNTTPGTSKVVNQTLQSPGQSLDKSTRSFMEPRFGFDFGKVKIHDDSTAHQSSKDINAHAYTHGNHIAFAAGKYQPNKNSGRRLIAHELTHVVQQSDPYVRHMGESNEISDSTPARRTAALSVMRQSAVGTTTNALLDNDKRPTLRAEVASRIGNVADKWRLAFGMLYTDEKTRPDENSWGFVAEAVFMLVTALLTDGLSTLLTEAVETWATKKFFSEGTR